MDGSCTKHECHWLADEWSTIDNEWRSPHHHGVDQRQIIKLIDLYHSRRVLWCLTDWEYKHRLKKLDARNIIDTLHVDHLPSRYWEALPQMCGCGLHMSFRHVEVTVSEHLLCSMFRNKVLSW